MNHLTIDIGNTDTVFGFWAQYAPEPEILRISTKTLIPEDSSFDSGQQHLLNDWKRIGMIKIIMSSVVPAATHNIYRLVNHLFKLEINVLDPSSFARLPLKILRPDQIGADLVANALAAHVLFHLNSIIVDFGTAMSFTTIDCEGKILGVSIAPGLQTAIKSLTSNAAQLFAVPLEMPASSLGQSTEHAIQAGIMYGYDGLVRGIIKSQEDELGYKLNVIMTGGLSQKIPKLKDIVNHYEPYLTLKGLKYALDYL